MSHIADFGAFVFRGLRGVEEPRRAACVIPLILWANAVHAPATENRAGNFPVRLRRDGGGDTRLLVQFRDLTAFRALPHVYLDGLALEPVVLIAVDKAACGFRAALNFVENGVVPAEVPTDEAAAEAEYMKQLVAFEQVEFPIQAVIGECSQLAEPVAAFRYFIEQFDLLVGNPDEQDVTAGVGEGASGTRFEDPN